MDKGIENLKQARAQLAVYRQALLKHAFEGKLTADWRAANADKAQAEKFDPLPSEEIALLPALPAEWSYARFSRFIAAIDAGKSFRCIERPPKSQEVGVAKVSAVTWGEYDETESKTCIDQGKIVPAYFIREGDFLFSRANTIELVGACVVVRRITQRVMLSDKTLRLAIVGLPKWFFLYFLRSHQGRHEIESRSTGNQESMRNIGQERIRSIILPVCSVAEAEEIIRRLDENLSAITALEADIATNLQKSEALRESILKKAFSGELVPQDPNDEPASVLLARIRTGRANAQSATSPRMRGRKPAAGKKKAGL